MSNARFTRGLGAPTGNHYVGLIVAGCMLWVKLVVAEYRRLRAAVKGLTR